MGLLLVAVFLHPQRACQLQIIGKHLEWTQIVSQDCAFFRITDPNALVLQCRKLPKNHVWVFDASWANRPNLTLLQAWSALGGVSSLCEGWAEKG